MIFRPLGLEDLNADLYKIYPAEAESIQTGSIGQVFQERIEKGMPCFVLENQGRPVAAASMLVETKFFREGGKAAHILDLSFLPECSSEKQKVIFMTGLKAEATARGCYKMILNCSQDLIPFFQGQAFEQKELQMALDLEPSNQAAKDPAFRSLKPEDMDRGFKRSLSALRAVDIPDEKIGQVFQERVGQGVKTYVLEKELEAGKQIVATASMIITSKLDGRKVAHIEDVAVDADYQGKGFGKMIMTAMKAKAMRKCCSAMVLDCSEENKTFYARNGYAEDGVQMRYDV